MRCHQPDRHGGTYCYSPMACAGWGYCRYRNQAAGVPDQATQDQWRAQDDPPQREVTNG